MATVTHYIYSHYEPINKEKHEEETERTVQDDEDVDPWQTESSFGAQRRVAGAPKFIAATFSYDEVNEMIGSSSQPIPKSSAPPSTSDVAGWYRSLARTSVNEPQQRPNTAPPEVHLDSPSTVPANSFTIKPPHVRRDKNSWFISRALDAELLPKPSVPSPSLADILAREPPPTASDQSFTPPVFLALGPSNRGWSMLERSGWSEGEGLGANAPRRADFTRPSSTSQGKAVDRSRSGTLAVKQEEFEVSYDSDGDIREVRKVDVVDLTLSDDDDNNGDTLSPVAGVSPSPPPTSTIDPRDSHTTPLLTPIATVLKSDRLGIGLKAKTVGPYKASKKRVTHNQAALAAHNHANEEMRRIKAITGRGSRGFARLAKAESEQRRQLLASLNSG